MLCPKCESRTQVVYTYSKKAGVVKRLRQCDLCNYRFKTIEKENMEKTI
jgi:transcriptional regulator NrdR family protein